MSGQTVDMLLAIQGRPPEPDLSAAIAELAEIVAGLAVNVAAMAIADGASSTRLAELRDMRDEAREIAGRLS